MPATVPALHDTGGVRWDSHAHPGYTVPAHYDSMIGKLLVHHPDRTIAIASMQRALRELRIEGIKTIVPRLLDILALPEFRDAQIDLLILAYRTYIPDAYVHHRLAYALPFQSCGSRRDEANLVLRAAPR